MIGRLGVPLGTVLPIRAVVVDGNDLGAKAYSGKYLLRVIEVDGRLLVDQPVMEFRKPGFVKADVVSTRSDLDELRSGKRSGSLGADRLAEIERGYVGREVRLVVYETGSFSGIPDGAPELWADTRFGFSTRLEVLGEH